MLSRSFLIFAVGGVFGFFVDAVAFYLFNLFIENPYICRLFSYIFAASFTWVFNRRFAFNIREPLVVSKQVFFEWLKYLSSQTVGFTINFTTFSALIYFSDIFARTPVLAIAIGSVAGLVINYTIAKIFVFGVKNSTD